MNVINVNKPIGVLYGGTLISSRFWGNLS